jgi:hypothetical protein
LFSFCLLPAFFVLHLFFFEFFLQNFYILVNIYTFYTVRYWIVLIVFYDCFISNISRGRR